MKDNCQVCHGERGGVRGNENVVDDVLMCDYCHADVLRQRQEVAEPREYDNSVLRDAASQLNAAAYRLRKAIDEESEERKRLIGEARALLWGAEARIK